MAFTIAQIAQALGARAVGDETLKITHASEPSTASETAIALATNETYAGAIGKGQAKAAVLWDGADWESYGLKAAVYVERPRYAMAGLSRVFDPGPEIDPGIHETAVIHPDALIATNPSIGPFVVIGRGAKVGRNARIGAHATIAEGAELGPLNLNKRDITGQGLFGRGMVCNFSNSPPTARWERRNRTI